MLLWKIYETDYKAVLTWLLHCLHQRVESLSFQSHSEQEVDAIYTHTLVCKMRTLQSSCVYWLTRSYTHGQLSAPQIWSRKMLEWRVVRFKQILCIFVIQQWSTGSNVWYLYLKFSYTNILYPCYLVKILDVHVGPHRNCTYTFGKVAINHQRNTHLKEIPNDL